MSRHHKIAQTLLSHVVHLLHLDECRRAEMLPISMFFFGSITVMGRRTMDVGITKILYKNQQFPHKIFGDGV